MTSTPAGTTTSSSATTADEVPIDIDVQARLEQIGLPALIAERTHDDWSRVVAHVADPMAADSRANYLAWLRRQVRAWTAVKLPTVPLASLDWPLASVRPQCLDVVGLIVADLREISPRNRPAVVPAQTNRHETTPQGALVAASLLCVAVAEPAARLLGAARALSAGTTAQGSATRYLTRCADLAERAPGLDREARDWGAAHPGQAQIALAAAERLTAGLADALEATTRTGW